MRQGRQGQRQWQQGWQATNRAIPRMARAMVMVMRWWATKRAIVRAARAIATVMRMEGNKEDNGKGGKGNGIGNDNGG